MIDILWVFIFKYHLMFRNLVTWIVLADDFPSFQYLLVLVSWPSCLHWSWYWCSFVWTWLRGVEVDYEVVWIGLVAFQFTGEDSSRPHFYPSKTSGKQSHILSPTFLVWLRFCSNCWVTLFLLLRKCVPAWTSPTLKAIGGKAMHTRPRFGRYGVCIYTSNSKYACTVNTFTHTY